MALTTEIKVILAALGTLYSCQGCGGLCQITNDMIKEGDTVIMRLTGEEKGIQKLCPYCKEYTVFRSITRLWIPENGNGSTI